MTPESPGLYLRLTVAETLACFADLYESPAPRERIAGALAAVNLTARSGDPYGALSKELRQRVALAVHPAAGHPVHLDAESRSLHPMTNWAEAVSLD